MQQARAAAGAKNVAVARRGGLLRQALPAGLLEELEMHIAPVMLGTAMRLLKPDVGLREAEGIELTPTRVMHSSRVTHFRFRVDGRAPLLLDDCGKDDR